MKTKIKILLKWLWTEFKELAKGCPPETKW